MKNFVLIGFPIKHSLSPIIQNKLFSMANIKKANYRLLEIKPGQIKSFLKTKNNIDGFNITSPYKTIIYENIEKLDESAKKFNSVNTAKKIYYNSHKGYNTDGFGFLKSLELKDIYFKKSLLLLGFGGAGKVISKIAIKKGLYVYIALRKKSFEKAKKTIKLLFNQYEQKKIKIIDILKIPKKHYNVIVNATPIGMINNMLPVSAEVIYNSSAAVDLIYSPKTTKFIETAKNFKIKTINGLPMLIYQAIKANEIFLGIHHKKNTAYKIKKELERYIC